MATADAEFDRIYKEMRACGDLAAAAEADLDRDTNETTNENNYKSSGEKHHEVNKGYEYVSSSAIPSLGDPLTPLTTRHGHLFQFCCIFLVNNIDLGLKVNQ